ncbi:MAG: DUF3299 domain-containing protein [Planctomycetota bacterium]|nr:DUF3299 domain-containing protein [Planctomycetota bacterium]
MSLPRLRDLLLAGIGALILVGAVYVGARASTVEVEARTRVTLPHGELVAAAQAARAGVDPYNPPGLPPGASIDPETGLLQGLDLAPPANTATPSWPLLATANEAATVADLPADLRALDGRQVVLGGFMVALYELRGIREFALVGSHTACCFGIPPGLGDQVVVRLPRGARGLALTLAPLRVVGTFQIRPQHQYPDGSGPLIWLYEVVNATAEPYGG